MNLLVVQFALFTTFVVTAFANGSPYSLAAIWSAWVVVFLVPISQERKLFMWLGCRPVVCTWVKIEPVDDDGVYHKIELIFRSRRWATDEDLNIERARVLTSVRAYLGCGPGDSIIRPLRSDEV